MLVGVGHSTTVATRAGSARMPRLVTINPRKCTSVDAKVHFLRLTYSSASLKDISERGCYYSVARNKAAIKVGEA